MIAQRFRVGEDVRTQAVVNPGHTRLPNYLAGKVGTIVAVCGAFPLADERARGIRDAPSQPVYSVRFDYDRHHVIADLWESYLEPVQ
jgi:nitrile hydratase